MADLDLGRRAILAGWRWMPGMLALPFHEDDDRSAPQCYPPWRVLERGVAGPWAADPTWGALPDFDDAATRGRLLELVREAWGPLAACAPSIVRPPGGAREVVWRVGNCERLIAEGPNEAAALVAALEAAPVRS